MKKQANKTQQLNEPVVAYNLPGYNPLSVLFGGQFKSISDFDIIAAVRHGIEKSKLLSLAKKLSLTIEELADILHISERTLQRYSPGTLVKAEYADRAIALAQLYERGVDVLGSAAAFNDWLRRPNYALRNQSPLSYLDTSVGFAMVLDILGRVEHGVFS